VGRPKKPYVFDPDRPGFTPTLICDITDKYSEDENQGKDNQTRCKCRKCKAWWKYIRKV
jgi:hypothetical protein